MSQFKTQCREELQSFRLALGFLTRLPVLRNVDYPARLMTNCGVYFPLVGLLLGAIYAIVYCALTPALTPLVAVLLVTVLHLLLTGALHEDGLADSADGLGGGSAVADKLRIMKDSQIGTYGVIALIMALALKVTLLVESPLTWVALLIAPCVARLTPLLFMRWLPYVTAQETNKTGLIASTFSGTRLFGAATFTAIAIYGASFWMPGLMLPGLIAIVGVGVIWGIYIKRKLGGYTGDTLGAAVVLSELLMLLLLI